MTRQLPPSVAMASTLVETLLAHGIEQVVLAPGSRSAALAQALHGAAEAGRLQLHVRIDERSAGFLALGIAKASLRPVPVVTTSGTAVGNLLPAVMEAHHTGVPLLVLSADRPITLHDTGANQTTQQQGMFANFVRAAAQISSGEGNPGHWQFQAERLLLAADGSRSNNPGPVHLNAAFTPPLVRAGGPQTRIEPTDFGEAAPAPAPVEVSGEGTVIVAGDATPEQGRMAVELASSGGFPLLAEPSSNARRAPALRNHRLLLERTDLAARVRRVIVFGHPTLSRPTSALLTGDVEVIAVAPTAHWNGGRVDRVVPAVHAARTSDPAWSRQWADADADLDTELDRAGRGGALDGPGLAAVVWSSLQDEGALVLGSSNVIRDAELAPIADSAPMVFANRGLAGIDGTVSTAAGISLALAGPVTLLLGDLTFQHDVGGLAVGPLERRPDLRIVVANDDGGSIFATLEYGAPEHAESFERIFGTPQGIDISLLAKGFGASHRLVSDADELSEVLSASPRGIEVVEVPIDRARRRERDRNLRGLGPE